MHRLVSGRFNPVGIVIGDVDSLKLVNDTLGHKAGDQLLSTVAYLMQKSFRNSDVVARIGGDEFAVLMPNCNESVVKNASERIKNEITVYNSAHETMPLSLSIGYAVGNTIPVNMDKLFKEADNNMYREKLHRHQSTRSAIVKTLTKALEARDLNTEGHAERLKGQVESLAKPLVYPNARYLICFCLLSFMISAKWVYQIVYSLKMALLLKKNLLKCSVIVKLASE